MRLWNWLWPDTARDLPDEMTDSNASSEPIGVPRAEFTAEGCFVQVGEVPWTQADESDLTRRLGQLEDAVIRERERG